MKKLIMLFLILLLLVFALAACDVETKDVSVNELDDDVPVKTFKEDVKEDVDVVEDEMVNADHETLQDEEEERTSIFSRLASSKAIIADHTAADDFDLIPACWIKEAKEQFVIGYGHTSHGSQITSGLDALNRIMTANGAQENLYSISASGFGDSLRIQEGGSYNDGTWLAYDVGYGGWDDKTRAFLDEEDFSDINTIMWSWCGQVASVDLESHYFKNMASLEDQYPDVIFVYMTGHLVANEGVLEANNKIRDFVEERNGVLFDFADIEKWDPSGEEHPKDTDACAWCTDWCVKNKDECDPILKEVSSCAHSHDYNCYRKAKAFWWMMARMAGWDGSANDSCP